MQNEENRFECSYFPHVIDGNGAGAGALGGDAWPAPSCILSYAGDMQAGAHQIDDSHRRTGSVEPSAPRDEPARRCHFLRPLNGRGRLRGGGACVVTGRLAGAGERRCRVIGVMPCPISTEAAGRTSMLSWRKGSSSGSPRPGREREVSPRPWPVCAPRRRRRRSRCPTPPGPPRTGRSRRDLPR